MANSSDYILYTLLSKYFIPCAVYDSDYDIIQMTYS